MHRATHRDYWQCPKCHTELLRHTEDYDYDVTCSVCAKSMRLIVREAPDDAIKLLAHTAMGLRALPEQS